ncbi:MAG: Cl-channel voltage-gated family protein [Synergistales bacterium 57_84]|nr:MAG: Cl-channel voltage-gated family protein [Synergistales bacterium 57_84]
MRRWFRNIAEEELVLGYAFIKRVALSVMAGRISPPTVPVKLSATIITIVTLLRLNEIDRKKSVVCGISAGFSAIFGTPVPGAIFGLEVGGSSSHGTRSGGPMMRAPHLRTESRSFPGRLQQGIPGLRSFRKVPVLKPGMRGEALYRPQPRGGPFLFAAS